MTLQACYYHPDIRQQVDKLLYFCQHVKMQQKEWGYYQNVTLPIHCGMKLLLILLDHGLQQLKTLVMNSMP